MPEYIVRYGAMRLMGLFQAPEGASFGPGSQVIIRTDRGQEMGTVLCEAEERTKSLVADQTNLGQGQILRLMTPQDAQELAVIHEEEKRKFPICLQYIERCGLSMRVIRVEQLFGGERIIVYYLAEQRVDFRELVKLLAREFQTRIEMRQIGVRDAARLLADYGDCGKPVCCNTHLIAIPPVSMRMAKLQKATLDPTKISGRCGRLKCCLRYEFPLYEAWHEKLPPIGAEVERSGERGRVVAVEPFSQQVWIEISGLGRRLVPAEDLKVLGDLKSVEAMEALGTESEGDLDSLSDA